MSTDKPKARKPKDLSSPPSISDAEWVVMKVVWEDPPVTANQVVDALKGEATWKPKTIHTLLRRLVQKGALACDKLGREHLFRPLVEAEHCRHAASRSLLELLFDGEIAPLLTTLLKRENLSREEIDELKRILDASKRGAR
jgi:BlaI family penicillinase repressor